MSKRVANTTEKTSRNKASRFNLRKRAILAKNERQRQHEAIADMTKPKQRVTCWNKVKNYIRRKCGR